MLYRIITEDKGIPELRLKLEECVADCFAGFTIIDSVQGYWKGVRENSIIFEISSESNSVTNFKIRQAASAIKKANKQEAVLIQKIHCESFFE